MLLIVTDMTLPANDRLWIVQSLIRGVESESGGVTVVSSLTDSKLHEHASSAIVAVLESDADAEVHSACEAAAAAQVHVSSVVATTPAITPPTVTPATTPPSTSAVTPTITPPTATSLTGIPLTMVLLESASSAYSPGTDHTSGHTLDHAPEHTSGNKPDPTKPLACTVRIRSDRPRRSTWTLRRLGRALASQACEPQRLEHSDRAIHLRSAATAAVDALTDLLDAKNVEEFQIRGGQSMMVQHSGGEREIQDSPFASDAELIDAVRFLAAYSGDRPQRFDELDPRLDIRVGTSWRLHAEAFVTSPPNVVLRSNLAGRMRLRDLGVACEHLERLLLEAVTGTERANIVVAAAMGGGKTTLCQALLAAVPDHERIDTIEDTPELRLNDYGIHPNAYERLTRDPNQDGHGHHSMADHIRDAKRSNADKLVVGEIRGDGCAALLDAMSSGISGCLVTLHSQPGKGVLEKLVAYACAEGAEPDYAQRQIAAAVDLCVWMGRNEAGQRVVADVTQLTGIDEQSGVIKTKCLWKLQPGERWAVQVGEPEGRLRQLYVASEQALSADPPAVATVSA